jgi:hypothetical protein
MASQEGKIIETTVRQADFHPEDDKSSTESNPYHVENPKQIDIDIEKQSKPHEAPVSPTGDDDPEAVKKSESNAPLHSAFTRRQRLFVVVMTALASFFSPLSGQIYFPAIPQLASDYHTTTGKINLTITTYMILQGLAPTIMGTFG